MRDHYGLYEWRVQVSADEGGTWTAAEGVDPAVPFTWPGSSPRERYDRYAGAAPGRQAGGGRRRGLGDLARAAGG